MSGCDSASLMFTSSSAEEEVSDYESRSAKALISNFPVCNIPFGSDDLVDHAVKGRVFSLAASFLRAFGRSSQQLVKFDSTENLNDNREGDSYLPPERMASSPLVINKAVQSLSDMGEQSGLLLKRPSRNLAKEAAAIEKSTQWPERQMKRIIPSRNLADRKQVQWRGTANRFVGENIVVRLVGEEGVIEHKRVKLQRFVECVWGNLAGISDRPFGACQKQSMFDQAMESTDRPGDHEFRFYIPINHLFFQWITGRKFQPARVPQRSGQLRVPIYGARLLERSKIQCTIIKEPNGARQVTATSAVEWPHPDRVSNGGKLSPDVGNVALPAVSLAFDDDNARFSSISLLCSLFLSNAMLTV
ncbi:hypothetical protein C8J56DRAFT_890621 [Mycena floridula]|nr:hypothetical protein C8J56DRAFT_890621 [Mycena floridula]